MKLQPVHFGLIDTKRSSYMYAACCLWTCKRVRCTLLASAVTCKGCLRMNVHKKALRALENRSG